MRSATAPLIVLALSMAGCSRGKVDARVNDATIVEEAPDLNIATVDHPELFALARVEARTAATELAVNGVVAPDVSRTVPVNLLTGGRVAEVKVRLGDEVRQGQLLLTLTSPDVSSAISEYQKFQADENLSKRQLERAQLLYSHGAIALKEVQVAEDAHDKARVDTRTAEQRIQILGGDLKRLTPLIEVRAPTSGTIIEQNVANASGVKSLDNAPNLFTIADLSRVWVLCDVYENNLAQVHMGDRAVVQLNAYPERKLEGRVSNMGTLLDPATRSAKVRVDLPNPGRLMRPNMFASVRFISKGTESRLMLPAGAILRLQDRDWVFVKQGPNKFRRTQVQGGPAAPDGYQQILSGARVGDTVAANALQFSRALENREQASK